jgi:poly(3-hydroxybutyrate) depolymerase
MHRRSFFISAAAVALAPSLTKGAAAGDTGVFERPEPAGASDTPQRVFYHRPAGWPANGRIVMVMHGVGRNASTYRNDWIAQAERYGFLLICPEFSQSKFPHAAWYNQGGVHRTADPTLWSFAVPDRVFADVRKRFGATASRYSLYGHSAGSQFVHRMLLIAPSTLVDQAIAANAGYYTLPLFDVPYPYGLQGLSVPDEQVANFLRWPLILLLGEADTNPNHPALLRNAEADKQGIHRFARGMNFLEVGKREAARRGLTLAWRVATVPGAGHSNRRMAPGAAAQFFS